MDKRLYQGRDNRDADRFRDGREMRDGYQGPRRDSRDTNQRDERSQRDAQAYGDGDLRQSRLMNRDRDRDFQGRKRAGDQHEYRDMRQMTEADLRHKIEDRRRGYNQQQAWDSSQGQFSGAPMKCFNCNEDGHHWSVCRNPTFCYSCRDTGHKSNQCPMMRSNKGLRLCAFVMPGQLFYSLNIPEPKPTQKQESETPIRAIVLVLEGRGSQFWRSLLDLRPWYKKGRVIEVKAGHQTRFWLDCWLGDCPLKVSFHKLFMISSNPAIEVADAFVNGQWCLTFRSQLNESQRHEWNTLQELLRDVQLTEGPDKVLWALERSHKYSTKSLYNAMTTGGVIDARMMMVWKCPIPLKVKIFVWMAVHDRIQCGVQLKKKRWTGLRNVWFVTFMKQPTIYFFIALWQFSYGRSSGTV